MIISRIIFRNPSRSHFEILTPYTWQLLRADDEIVIQVQQDGKWIDSAVFIVPETWRISVIGQKV